MKWLQRISILILVALATVIAIPAQAAPTISSAASEADLSILEVGNGTAVVETDAGVIVARYDAETETASVEESDGTTFSVDVSGIASIAAGAPAALQAGSSGADHTLNAETNASFTCSMALHVVGLIHSYGWGAAAGIALAMGAAGAAVVSFVMLIGVDAFLVWASTNC